MSAISRVFHDPEAQRAVRSGQDVNPELLNQVEEEGFCVLPSVIDRAAAASVREASVLAGMSSELQQQLGLGSPNRGYGAYLVRTAPQPRLGS